MYIYITYNQRASSAIFLLLENKHTAIITQLKFNLPIIKIANMHISLNEEVKFTAKVQTKDFK